MAKVTPTLSIGLTFRNAETITEVERLHQEIANTKFTKGDIYLVGLRQLASAVNKAKSISK